MFKFIKSNKLQPGNHFCGKEPVYISQFDLTDRYWRKRACGIVGLEMVLKTVYGGKFSKSTKELIEEGLELDGYDIKNDIGWYHKALVELAKKYGLESKRLEHVSPQKVVKFLQDGYYVLASIKSSSGGHLLLIYGFKVDGKGNLAGFWLHDSGRIVAGGGKGKYLSLDSFAERSKGRIILFRK